MVFDVNDFDEAYIGHFSWDLRRFVASLALMGWQKALPEDTVRNLIGRYLRAYLAQVTHYAEITDDDDFALHLDNTDGPVNVVLTQARTASRVALLDGITALREERPGLRGGRHRAAARPGRAAQGREGVRQLPRDDPGVQAGSTATCSTRSVTSSASPASASAAPGCRRTTCWSRATASRSTTTWCCR